MNKIISPTVGRKVWFRPGVHDKAGSNGMVTAGAPGQEHPLDATVIAVWGDRMVNLLVVDIMGKLYPKTSVTLRQEGDEPPVGSYCEWMPYQTAQAAKQEAAEVAA